MRKSRHVGQRRVCSVTGRRVAIVAQIFPREIQPARGTSGQVQGQRPSSISRYRKRLKGLPRLVESERAHQPIIRGRLGMSAGVRWCKSTVI
jgi:hypothetical protein